ncbi:peptidoglycan DD-metalloendopeptidase family protein, partial [bacterium]|nr:peptidoglycan DD-metalloendopeptidase family protein [bacterium]
NSDGTLDTIKERLGSVLDEFLVKNPDIAYAGVVVGETVFSGDINGRNFLVPNYIFDRYRVERKDACISVSSQLKMEKAGAVGPRPIDRGSRGGGPLSHRPFEGLGRPDNETKLPPSKKPASATSAGKLTSPGGDSVPLAPRSGLTSDVRDALKPGKPIRESSIPKFAQWVEVGGFKPEKPGETEAHVGYDFGGYLGTDGNFIIGLPSGLEIYPIADGVVISRSNLEDITTSSYHQSLQIRHDDGTVTEYAHVWSEVEIGQRVTRDTVVGCLVGAERGAQQSKYVHLHINVRRDGQELDPREVIGFEAQDSESTLRDPKLRIIFGNGHEVVGSSYSGVFKQLFNAGKVDMRGAMGFKLRPQPEPMNPGSGVDGFFSVDNSKFVSLLKEKWSLALRDIGDLEQFARTTQKMEVTAYGARNFGLGFQDLDPRIQDRIRFISGLYRSVIKKNGGREFVVQEPLMTCFDVALGTSNDAELYETLGSYFVETQTPKVGDVIVYYSDRLGITHGAIVTEVEVGTNEVKKVFVKYGLHTYSFEVGPDCANKSYGNKYKAYSLDPLRDPSGERRLKIIANVEMAGNPELADRLSVIYFPDGKCEDPSTELSRGLLNAGDGIGGAQRLISEISADELLALPKDQFIAAIRGEEVRMFPELGSDEGKIFSSGGIEYVIFEPSWYFKSGMISQETIKDLRANRGKKVLMIGEGPAHLSRFLVERLGVNRDQIAISDINDDQMPNGFQKFVFNMWKPWPKGLSNYDYIFVNEATFINRIDDPISVLTNLVLTASGHLNAGGVVGIKGFFSIVYKDGNSKNIPSDVVRNISRARNDLEVTIIRACKGADAVGTILVRKTEACRPDAVDAAPSFNPSAPFAPGDGVGDISPGNLEYIRRAKPSDAVAAIRRYPREVVEKYPDLMLIEATALLYEGQHQTSFKVVSLILEKYGNDPTMVERAIFLRARIFLRGNNLKKAEEDGLELIDNRESRNIKVYDMLARVYAKMGVQERQLGRTLEALVYEEKALAVIERVVGPNGISPGDYVIMARKAKILLQMGRCEEASDAIDFAVRASPYNVEFTFIKARTLINQGKRFKEIIPYFDRLFSKITYINEGMLRQFRIGFENLFASADAMRELKQLIKDAHLYTFPDLKTKIYELTGKALAASIMPQ